MVVVVVVVVVLWWWLTQIESECECESESERIPVDTVIGLINLSALKYVHVHPAFRVYSICYSSEKTGFEPPVHMLCSKSSSVLNVQAQVGDFLEKICRQV